MPVNQSCIVRKPFPSGNHKSWFLEKENLLPTHFINSQTDGWIEYSQMTLIFKWKVFGWWIMHFRLIWLKKSSFTFDLPLGPWFFTSFSLWSSSLILLNSFSLQILSFSNSCWHCPTILLPTLIWDPTSSFWACLDNIATWIVKQVRDDFSAARVLLAIFFSSIFF